MDKVRKKLREGIEEAQDIIAGRRLPARSRRYSGKILVEIVENGTVVWTLNDAALDMKEEWNPLLENWGERVKKIRATLRQSQSGFAELLGISVGTLQGWEQGRRQPRSSGKKLLQVASTVPEALISSSPHP